MVIKKLAEIEAEKNALEEKAKRRLEKKEQRKLEEEADLKKLRKLPGFDEEYYKSLTPYQKTVNLGYLGGAPDSCLAGKNNFKTKKMSKMEAEVCIEKIKTNNRFMMILCYELWVREGYKKLISLKYKNGYPDFKTCVMNELDGFISYDYAHKMKNAGAVHMVVCPDLPMGRVPESVLRPMHGLTDKEMNDVWSSSNHDEFNGEIPTAQDIGYSMKNLGLKDSTTNFNLEQRQFNIKLSPEIEKQIKKDALKLIKEFFKKSPPYELRDRTKYNNKTVTKENFEKTVKFLLKKLCGQILAEYEKYTFSLESGMTESNQSED